MEDWKAQAKALFFVEHIDVGTIANVVRKNRSTVSRFINGCEGYVTEILFRRKQSEAQRKKYQSDWDKENRPERYRHISGETLRKEHEDAVKELSRERFYGRDG